MNIFYRIIFISLFCTISVYGQQIPGGTSTTSGLLHEKTSRQQQFVSPQLVKSGQDFVYSATTYTFADLVVFSYFDSSGFSLYNTNGEKIDSVIINKNEYYVFSPGQGVFHIEGNKSFTLLIGDPVSAIVMGYFAVDESGSPLSTNLLTYMPDSYWGGEHFILFAYNDGTEYNVQNLTDSSTISAGVLNKGEHIQLDNVFNKFLSVTSNKPVSALSYTDQGYFIPSDNGTFFGLNFYGFSGYVGNWTNGVVITAYNDNTEYLVLNSTTGDTIAIDTLNTGQASEIPITQDTYWQLTTNKGVTVNNTPYAAWSSGYFYLTRQIDETGRGIGTNFYCPVIEGDINIFSYSDSNKITITNPDSLVKDQAIELNNYESYYFYSYYKTVYHITGTKNLSVVSSNGGSNGADFMPLNFTLGLPDLAVSANNINFDPDSDLVDNDLISIKATVNNFGYQTAYNVEAQFFDGDPQGGYTIGKLMTVDSIPAQGSHAFMVNWTVPSNPEYHAVYIQVDGSDKIVESNSSNNIAYKFLIPNDDLLPPLAVIVKAPVSIMVQNDTTDFSDFNIDATVLNSGDITAPNSYAILHLPDGLSTQMDDSVYIGSLGQHENTKISWPVKIDYIPDTEAYFYSIEVGSDTTAAKLVERMLLINRPTAIGNDKALNVLPTRTDLAQNYPNPFNPVTTIEYDIATSGKVIIDVFNITGQKIATLVNGARSVGHYKETFNAEKLSSGIYFIRLNLNGQDIAVRRITFIK